MSASAAEWPSATPSQELFVSSVTESLQEAAEHPDAHPMYWAVSGRSQGSGGQTDRLRRRITRWPPLKVTRAWSR